MKYIFIFIYILFCIFSTISCSTINHQELANNNGKQYEQYEHYLDSLWENNPDYYLDVEMENDKYLNYVEHQQSNNNN